MTMMPPSLIQAVMNAADLPDKSNAIRAVLDYVPESPEAQSVFELGADLLSDPATRDQAAVAAAGPIVTLLRYVDGLSRYVDGNRSDFDSPAIVGFAKQLAFDIAAAIVAHQGES